jgi:hypothetical protein
MLHTITGFFFKKVRIFGFLKKRDVTHMHIIRDENGTEIFRIDRFRFLYYEPFFNIKNYQFQLVSQSFSIIFCTL